MTPPSSNAERERKRKKEIKDSLRVLQKGRGIWKENLHDSLRPALRELWSVPVDAMPDRVRQIVIVRLKSLVDVFTSDPHVQTCVWNAYGLGANRNAGLMERRAALYKRVGRRQSPSTQGRTFDCFLELLLKSVDSAPFPEPTAAELRAARGWLEKNTPPGYPDPSAEYELTAAIRNLDNPVRSVLRSFLESTVHVPVTEAGVLIRAQLEDRGHWLFAFLDEHALAHYRTAAGANWTRIESMLGRDVISEAAHSPTPAGVLINPAPGPDADIDTTLPLPPEIVAELATDS
jgi:hypothetical protein